MEYNNPHPDAQSFEQAIDANPFDSNNHAVYADWLDEHDQPHEAAFRRSMADWVRRQNRHEIQPWDAIEPHDPVNNTTTVWGTFPTADFPKGVDRFNYHLGLDEDVGDLGDARNTSINVRHPLYPHGLGLGNGVAMGTLVDRQPHDPQFMSYEDHVHPHSEAIGEPHRPNHVARDQMQRAARFEWPNYRSMERSFRESFYHNLNHNQQRFSRDIQAAKIVRKQSLINRLRRRLNHAKRIYCR